MTTQTWYDFLEKLPDEDSDWLLEHGIETMISGGELLIEKGKSIPNLFFVLRGLFRVAIGDLDQASCPILGAGALIGEMSFAEDTAPTTDVVAMEESCVFSLPRDVLTERIESDNAFAAHFFRALSGLLADRLKETSAIVGGLSMSSAGGANAAKVIEEGHPQLVEAINGFKTLYSEVNRRALDNGGVVSDEDFELINGAFTQMSAGFTEFMFGQDHTESVRREIGELAQRELLPMILLTDTAERFYSKPRGYAGDYHSIELTYRNEPGGKGHMGELIDRIFLGQGPGKAVRNRRGLLTREIRKTLASVEGRNAQIMSIACGPAREITDIITDERPENMKLTLLDLDLQALAHVDDKMRELKYWQHTKLVNENVLYLALGRSKLELPEQDLVYSIGLIDYFSDKAIIRLLNYIHKILRPGGRVILGNFHPKNEGRAFMDYVLEWQLIHRTEEEMNHLFETSDFGKPCSEIYFEEEGINLFAEGVKE